MSSKKENKIVLETKNLAIGYTSKKQQTTIAKNLNIQLEKGKLICLLGKNGIGKSTLLRTLSKTQEKLSGNIYLGNLEIDAISTSQIAKKMSLVLTERIPDSQLTVFELVALGRQPYTNWLGTLTKEDFHKVENALHEIDILELKDKKNYELSDGQLQKVMIARALAQDTDIIILDEPTAHLDIHHKIEVFKLLQKLAKQTQKTILLSTHEVNLAIKIADQLWLMSQNNFTSGSLNTLIKEKAFDNLFPKDKIYFSPKTNQFTMVE